MHRKKWGGGLLIGVVVLVGAGLAWCQMDAGDVPLDSASCPVDGDYPGQIAVLLDPSDPLNTPQSFVVDQITSALDRESPEKTEIKTFTVAQAGRQDTVPAYRACRPVHFDSIPWSERARVNRRMIEEAYDDFNEGLLQSLSGVLRQSDDTTSPILEAIQTSVLSAFRPRDANTPRWLLIVSDMAQNSDNWSFYGDQAEPTDFRELSRQPFLRSLRVDLTGVRVTIYQLARRGVTGRIQQRNLRQFWDDYFLDMGADTPVWVDVEG